MVRQTSIEVADGFVRVVKARRWMKRESLLFVYLGRGVGGVVFFGLDGGEEGLANFGDFGIA